MDRLVMYIFTIARSHTDRPFQSINCATLSSTDWPTDLQFNVQWIGRECTYSSLLGLIPTGHPNPLTMLLHPVPIGRHIPNSLFNGSAGNVHIHHCSVSYRPADRSPIQCSMDRPG